MTAPLCILCNAEHYRWEPHEWFPRRANRRPYLRNYMAGRRAAEEGFAPPGQCAYCDARRKEESAERRRTAALRTNGGATA